MNARTRTLVGLLAIGGYALLAAGSFGAPAPPTIRLIIQHRQLLISLATQTLKASGESAQSIDTAFEDLRGHLHAAALTTETIERMERTNADLKQRSAVLQQSLRNTEHVAKEWFNMLERRAKQNQTATMRRELLDEIKTRERSFNERMRTARGSIEQIGRSVQKYDDVVGYVQVKAGLAGIDQQLVRIDDIIDQANTLDNQIQAAITEGVKIIESLNLPAEG